MSTKPRYVVTMGVGFRGYQLSLGDTVTVTWDNIVTPSGDVGLDEITMRIVGIRYNWRTGGAPVELELEHRPDLGAKLWAPAAYVSTITDVTHLILDGTTFGGGLQNDYEFFKAGYAVRFFNTVNNSYHDDVLSAVSGANITLTTGIPGGWVVGDVIFMSFDDYTNQVAAGEKQEITYANQTDSKGYVTGTTEGDKWV